MTGYLGKTTNGGREVVGAQAQSEREDMLGPMPGEVVAYHADRGTVDVQPLFKRRKWDGTPLPYPVLLEVPLDQPRSGNAAITMPVPVGTRVMLVPMMRSGDNYEADDDGSPSDSRSFNLSDMRASLSGGDSLSAPLKNVDPDNMHIRADPDGNYGVRLSPDGKVKIEGSEGNIYLEICEGFDQCEQMARYLSEEPALIYRAEYDAIANMLKDIVTKLNAMAL